MLKKGNMIKVKQILGVAAILAGISLIIDKTIIINFLGNYSWLAATLLLLNGFLAFKAGSKQKR